MEPANGVGEEGRKALPAWPGTLFNRAGGRID